jgi:hypothetical protein
MGSSFYLGWLIPRETSLVIWGSEGEGSRFKASKVKDRLPFTDYCQYDSQGEDLPLNGTCLRDKTKKLENVLQWLVLQILMTIFNIYEH